MFCQECLRDRRWEVVWFLTLSPATRRVVEVAGLCAAVIGEHLDECLSMSSTTGVSETQNRATYVKVYGISCELYSILKLKRIVADVDCLCSAQGRSHIELDQIWLVLYENGELQRQTAPSNLDKLIRSHDKLIRSHDTPSTLLFVSKCPTSAVIDVESTLNTPATDLCTSLSEGASFGSRDCSVSTVTSRSTIEGCKATFASIVNLRVVDVALGFCAAGSLQVSSASG